MIYCFGKNEYYITNFWARIYIGSFLLAVVVSTLSIYMYQRVVRGRNLMKNRQSNDQKVKQWSSIHYIEN